MADAKPNAREAEFWTAAATETWVPLQARLDRLLRPITAALLDRAAPAPGERVLDVGCGSGETVLEVARRVGPAGRVLGCDISGPMVARARQRIAEAGLPQAAVEEADASIRDFPAGGFDLVVSRFGVMFFNNPVEAFANLRRASAPGGRLAFACWRAMAENPWVTVPLQAARPLLLPMEPPAPDAPGQFAFGDRTRVEGILAAAGFREVAIAPHDAPMALAGPGPAAAAEAAAFSVRMGPAARALRDQPELLEPVRQAMEAAYAGHAGPEGVVLPGGIWLVAARA